MAIEAAGGRAATGRIQIRRRFIPSEEVGAGAVEDPDPEAAIS